MKSVGEKGSEMSNCLIFHSFLKNLTFRQVHVTWVIKCVLLGCTLVSSMKSVGEIADIASCLVFYPF